MYAVGSPAAPCSSGSPASASPSSSGGTPTRPRCAPWAPARSRPEEAPELHGMIDRLCAMADMPKPRVAIADTDLPNAFATGRSPNRSVVCVTTGILRTLTAEELEGVLAHELSHVAHRDVLVMTVAVLGGHRRRAWSPGCPVRRPRARALAQQQQQRRRHRLLRRAADQPGRLRDQLRPAAAALALPRAVRRPLGCLPDPEAVGARVGA